MPSSVDPVIAAWQTDHHEIGAVEFAPTGTAVRRFSYYALPEEVTFIGIMEVDALCVQQDGSLCVFDHELQNRIVCGAAKSQRSFIDAMKELEQHFDRCAEDDSYCDDLNAAEFIRDRCAGLAGGDEFLPFFSSMVGV